jgi:hypothetical protein
VQSRTFTDQSKHFFQTHFSDFDKSFSTFTSMSNMSLCLVATNSLEHQSSPATNCQRTNENIPTSKTEVRTMNCCWPDTMGQSSSARIVISCNPFLRLHHMLSQWHQYMFLISEVANNSCSCGNCTSCKSSTHHSIMAWVRLCKCQSCSSQCSTQQCSFPVVFTQGLLEAIIYS